MHQECFDSHNNSFQVSFQSVDVNLDFRHLNLWSSPTPCSWRTTGKAGPDRVNTIYLLTGYPVGTEKYYVPSQIVWAEWSEVIKHMCSATKCQCRSTKLLNYLMMYLVAQHDWNDWDILIQFCNILPHVSWSKICTDLLASLSIELHRLIFNFIWSIYSTATLGNQLFNSRDETSGSNRVCC